MTDRRRQIAIVAMLAALAVLGALAVWLYLAARQAPEIVASSPPPPPPPKLASPSPSPSPSRPPSPSPSPPPSPTADAPPAASRKTLLDGVRVSGQSHEVWEEQARQLLTSLAVGDTIVAYEGCYVAGCAATLSFASQADLDRARAEAERMDTYRAWTGGKRWSAPDTAEDGRLLVALILYRPD